MDYVAWCDEICTHLADFGETQPGNFVNLSSFASDFLRKQQQPESSELNESVILACDSVFRTFGNGLKSPILSLTDDDIVMLRSTYARWSAVFKLEVSDQQLLVLEVLNRHSIVERNGSYTVESVKMNEIMADAGIADQLSPMSKDQVTQALKKLDNRKLARLSLFIGDSSCKATYAGAVRLTRDQVISDAEIDQLRVQGESEVLDFKRHIKTSNKSEKAEFARDVLAFANGSGDVKKLLVGLEDDGTFTTPADPEGHKNLIMSLSETTLQQIVSERTIQTPSIRITARGIHRDGPYAVIEVRSNIGHLPYRFFETPGNSKLPGAAQSGEVIVRKGTTKQRASTDEIAALEKRAALYRHLNPGSV